jgi:glycosyltransferase involved in cell wall biosynthesis
MKVMFLSNEHRFEQSGTAYGYRLEKLRCAIQRHGIHTEFLSLREQPFRRPLLAHPLNLPFILKKMTDSDFIHAGGDAGYTAALLKPFTRARVIHDVHGDTLSEAQLEWTARRGLFGAYRIIQALIINTLAYHHADYFLVVSKPMQQWLMDERRIPEHRIGLVRNGVDLQLFARIPDDPTKGFVVCYSGGFQHWQGIENLVSAVELLSRDRVWLKIVGFTEHHTELKSSIARRLGDRVQLVDRVTQRELVSQLATATVLAIPRPSHRAVEVAFPTKFSEYLALGKPVIVCDVDETARLVQQHHCGLVSEPSPAALADTILAASNLTQAELELMGKNARRLAESEFSWEDIGRKYAELLAKWVSA